MGDRHEGLHFNPDEYNKVDIVPQGVDEQGVKVFEVKDTRLDDLNKQILDTSEKDKWFENPTDKPVKPAKRNHLSGSDNRPSAPASM